MRISLIGVFSTHVAVAPPPGSSSQIVPVRGLDPVAVAPAVLVVLDVVVEEEDVRLLDLVEVASPGYVRRLNDGELQTRQWYSTPCGPRNPRLLCACADSLEQLGERGVRRADRRSDERPRERAFGPAARRRRARGRRVVRMRARRCEDGREGVARIAAAPARSQAAVPLGALLEVSRKAAVHGHVLQQQGEQAGLRASRGLRVGEPCERRRCRSHEVRVHPARRERPGDERRRERGRRPPGGACRAASYQGPVAFGSSRAASGSSSRLPRSAESRSRPSGSSPRGPARGPWTSPPSEAPGRRRRRGSSAPRAAELVEDGVGGSRGVFRRAPELSIRKCAKARFSATGICAVDPRLRGALVEAVAREKPRELQGGLAVHDDQPIEAQVCARLDEERRVGHPHRALRLRRRPARLQPRTRGCTIALSRSRAAASSNTSAPSAMRSSAPRRSTSRPNAASISPSAGLPAPPRPAPPGRGRASAQPRAASRCNTCVLPDAMPPVRPTRSRASPQAAPTAALTVFAISIAIVSGPTPPGTGVSAPATCATSRACTSPTSA